MSDKPQNKFTRSVIERLEQENIKKSEDNLKKTETKKPKIDTKKPEKIEKEKKVNIKLNDIINPVKERNAKNKTFYLDVEIIESLQQQAKSLNMTDSKLVNEILKAVL